MVCGNVISAESHQKTLVLSHTETSRPRFYRPELDCLRFLAFLTVFVSHAFSNNPDYYIERQMSPALSLWLSKAVASGGLGVVLFFVLSSYLITELLIREHNLTGRIDVKSFYVRRALRIWPLYFVFLLLIYLIIPQESPFALEARFLFPMLLFVGNWACIVFGGMGQSVAGPLWSISVEEQFYLTWPLIISRIGVDRLKNTCIGLIIFANVTRIIMQKKGAGFIDFWCNTVCWLDAIAAGALIALFLRGNAPERSVRSRLLLGIGGLVLWVLTRRFRDSLIYPDIISYPLVIIGSCMILLAMLGTNTSNPILVYFGRISYGLYVFHAAALVLAAFVFVRYSFKSALVGLAITLVMGAISYRWLEQPFLKLKKRFTYVMSEPVAVQEPLSVR